MEKKKTSLDDFKKMQAEHLDEILNIDLKNHLGGLVDWTQFTQSGGGGGPTPIDDCHPAL